MKVIKQGKNQENYTKKCKCSKCGCEFEYSDEDINKVYLGRIYGNHVSAPRYAKVVYCPNCSKSKNVYDSKDYLSLLWFLPIILLLLFIIIFMI